MPLHACEHYYVLFQDVPGLHPDLPVLRDYDHCSYFKYDAGKLLVGAFEPNARPWGMSGIPEDFSFGEIAGDFSHFEPVLLDAMRRVPALEQRRHPKVLLRPGKLHAGRALPSRRVVRTGQLLRRRGPQLDRTAVGRRHRQGGRRMDPRRPPAARSVGSRRPAQYAVPDQSQISAGARFGEPGPLVRHALAVPSVRNRARRAQIGAARSLERGGRVFRRGLRLGTGQLVCAGGRPAEYAYSYGRQNWFEHSAREHRAVRSAVGLFDQSSFAKFRLEGADAVRVLNRVCANDVAVAPGKIIYTQWLNERGGIEADLTVTRLSETRLFDRDGRGNRNEGFQLAAAAHRSRRALRLDQRDFRHGCAVADGAAIARAAAVADAG